MATIPPDTVVLPLDMSELTFPPRGHGVFSIAVHPAALRSRSNLLTQVIEVNEDELLWAGAIDESMVRPNQGSFFESRAFLAKHLLCGPALWAVITPGDLLRPPVSRRTTIYRGRRPWIVIGETRSSLLAAPLNSGSRESLYQTTVFRSELPSGTKHPDDSKLELNHLWSFPRSVYSIGLLATDAHARLTDKIRQYYPSPP